MTSWARATFQLFNYVPPCFENYFDTANDNLLSSQDQMEPRLDAGFTFIANGADAGMVAAGMRENGAFFAKYKDKG